VSYFTSLGCAISRHVRLNTALNVQPRLYTGLLGESWTAKKSTAIYHTDSFFQQVNHAQPLFKTIYGLGSAEGVARALGDDGLPLLISFDELKTFVDKTKQEGNVGLPMITSLFEQNNWDNYTVKKTISIRDAHISFIAACTTATYERMWTATYIDIGFINRLFVVSCARTRKVAMPKMIPTVPLEALIRKTREQVISIIDGPRPRMLEIDQGGLALWEDWYQALEDSVHARRLDTIGMRLMLLLAVTTSSAKVTRDIVSRVIDILDYELRVRRLTDPIDAENIIAKLEEKIRRVVREHPGLKRRQIQQRVHGSRYGIKLFNDALRNLEANKEIRCDRASKTFYPNWEIS
jgi:hypothetical protein